MHICDCVKSAEQIQQGTAVTVCILFSIDCVHGYVNNVREVKLDEKQLNTYMYICTMYIRIHVDLLNKGITFFMWHKFEQG